MKRTFSTAVLLVAGLTAGSASAATVVYNVNIGSGIDVGQGFEITTDDNYIGAATENTANSTWNVVNSTTPSSLADSTGTASSVTFDLSDNASFGTTGQTDGDEVFKSWVKDDGNDDAWTATFGGLDTSATYDVVVYSGWFWGPEAVPVNLTAGTGLNGTFILNSLDMDVINNASNPLSTGVAQDTDPADAAGDFNFARFNGLQADSSGNLTLSFGVDGANNDFPINGFQLVAVPEPSSLALLGLGGLMMARRRRG